MTTIAYRDGVMAADSQVTGGDMARGEAQKVGRTKKGWLVGISGASGMLDEVIAWLDAGAVRADYPKVSAERPVWGLVAVSDKRVAVLSPEGVMQWANAAFHAQGSGNEIAMGAMAMGASAEQAVRIVSEFDVYTGGRITKLSLSADLAPNEETR
ncbi:hypothetical protein [Aminobacter sp. MDW-2]|uniref:hypothetical protein n=1 Tax=Aminobacter sp. MDW-2 TaxID=2666139 RepID=UPI0012AFE889|nr:hypothetical protein [Aminobacter sp. MDW-2]MRX32818.1 hypothetical protein [Aminobacter sp. MDW-2]QNH34523.1 hypothetical protein H5P29_00785 [Aminobacter sp. MDW-2]